MNKDLLNFGGISQNFSYIQEMVDRQTRMINPFKHTLDLINNSGINNTLNFLDKQPFLAILKKMHDPTGFANLQLSMAKFNSLPTFSAQSIILKMLSSTGFIEQYKIPDHISAFSSMQSSMLANLKSLKPVINLPNWYSQLDSFTRTLSAISVRTAGLALSEVIDEDVLVEIETQTSRVVGFAEELMQTTTVNENDINKLSEFIGSVSKSNLLTNPHLSGGLMAMLFVLFQIMGTLNSRVNRSANIEVTQQFKVAGTALKNTFEEQIQKGSNIRILSHNIKVYSTANSQSPVIFQAMEGQNAHVTDTDRQWALINYATPEGILVSGWVLKKYLKCR